MQRQIRAAMLAYLLAPMALLMSACAHEASVDEIGCSTTQVERNEASARIVFEEVLSRGRIAENEHIYSPEFVAHGLTRDANREQDRAATEGWRRAVPDLRITVQRLTADCDQVAVHWLAEGVNTGEGMGLPATGRALRVPGMTFFRLREGQITDEWTVFDQYAMLQQLGLLPDAGR